MQSTENHELLWVSSHCVPTSAHDSAPPLDPLSGLFKFTALKGIPACSGTSGLILNEVYCVLWCPWVQYQIQYGWEGLREP